MKRGWLTNGRRPRRGKPAKKAARQLSSASDGFAQNIPRITSRVKSYPRLIGCSGWGVCPSRFLYYNSVMEIKVLYEDNHLIAVYKPAGVLVQAGEDGDHDDNTLYWQVKMFLKERDQKPGNVFLGVLHRLDRNVSGVILFAKTSKGAARLSEQIRERTIKKIYHAVVIGVPVPAAGTLEHHLRKDESSKQSMIDPEGDVAILHYETVKSGPKNSLLRIELETGRFHQIRVQLSEIGHPVVGDIKYGAPALPAEALAKDGSSNFLALCATELHFKTATTDEDVTISIDIPSEWSKFV